MTVHITEGYHIWDVREQEEPADIPGNVWKQLEPFIRIFADSDAVDMTVSFNPENGVTNKKIYQISRLRPSEAQENADRKASNGRNSIDRDMEAARCSPEEAEDDWEWKLLPEGGAEITAYIGAAALRGHIVIPDTLGGHPVISLGNRLFYECKQMEEVTLPDTIHHLGDAVFCICNGLRRINFPQQLREIPADAFNECGFTELCLPDRISSVRRGAFINNRELVKVTLSPEMTEIPLMIFAGCGNLREAVIPDSVRVIQDGAFSGCKSLEGVHLPEELTSIGTMAFLSCDRLREVVIPESVQHIGDMAFPESTRIIRR